MAPPRRQKSPVQSGPSLLVKGVAQEIQKVPGDHQPALDTRSWSEDTLEFLE